MKLRNMSAEVVPLQDIVIEENRFGEVRYICTEYGIALKSYKSIVAIYTDSEIYMLPRYDYSPTTWKHVHAFIQDCTDITDLYASDMRRAFKDCSFRYHKAEGFDTGMRIWYDEHGNSYFVSTESNRLVDFECREF